MSILGAVISLPLLLLGLLISAIPVWLAGKIVGAGHQELWRAAVALVLATLLAVLATVVGVKVISPWMAILFPVVFVVVIAKVLDVSYLGAFVLCILSAAIQVAVTKAFAALAGG